MGQRNQEDVEAVRQELRAAVGRFGLAGVARKLGLPRTTLASFFGGACREGTELLVLTRAEAAAASLRGAPPMAMRPTPGVVFGEGHGVGGVGGIFPRGSAR